MKAASSSPLLIAVIYSARIFAADHSASAFDDDVDSHTLEVVDPETGNRVGLMGDGKIKEVRDVNGKVTMMAFTGESSCAPEIEIHPTGGPAFPIPLEEFVKTSVYKLNLEPRDAAKFLGIKGNKLVFDYRAKGGKFTFQLLDEGNWYTWEGAIPVCANNLRAPDLIRRPLTPGRRP